MPSFDARLRLIGQPGLPLAVEIDLTDQEMTVRAGHSEVATWRFSDVGVASEADGYHVKAEGEEIVLNITDSRRFAVELGRVTALTRSPVVGTD